MDTGERAVKVARGTLRREDIRGKMTKQALSGALTVLLHRKAFHSITVNDICAQAAISRTTFYLHFRDKYELAVFNLEDFVRYIDENSGGDPEVQLEVMLTVLEDNRRAFHHLFDLNGDPFISDVLYNWFVSLVERNGRRLTQKDHIHQVPMELIALFYAAGLAQAVVWWVEGKLDYTREEMKNHLRRMQLLDPFAAPAAMWERI